MVSASSRSGIYCQQFIIVDQFQTRVYTLSSYYVLIRYHCKCIGRWVCKDNFILNIRVGGAAVGIN